MDVEEGNIFPLYPLAVAKRIAETCGPGQPATAGTQWKPVCGGRPSSARGAHETGMACKVTELTAATQSTVTDNQRPTKLSIPLVSVSFSANDKCYEEERER